MFCKNCGAEIVDGNFCKNCGAKVSEEPTPIVETRPVEENPKAKVDSVLSVISCILTFIGLFFFGGLAVGGIVCGVVDLCMKDTKKRHLGSWFGVIVGFIVLIVYFIRLESIFK